MTKQKNKPRRSHSKRERYKVTNWPEYNRSLKNRGNLQIWIPFEFLDNWYYSGIKEKGGQLDYSDTCIELCLSIKFLFKLGYRQTQGFIESVFALAEINLVVPAIQFCANVVRNSKLRRKPLGKEKTKKGSLLQQIAPV